MCHPAGREVKQENRIRFANLQGASKSTAPARLELSILTGVGSAEGDTSLTADIAR